MNYDSRRSVPLIITFDLKRNYYNYIVCTMLDFIKRKYCKLIYLTDAWKIFCTITEEASRCEKYYDETRILARLLHLLKYIHT